LCVGVDDDDDDDDGGGGGMVSGIGGVAEDEGDEENDLW
jgi:hypothetical protein